MQAHAPLSSSSTDAMSSSDGDRRLTEIGLCSPRRHILSLFVVCEHLRQLLATLFTLHYCGKGQAFVAQVPLSLTSMSAHLEPSLSIFSHNHTSTRTIL